MEDISHLTWGHASGSFDNQANYMTFSFKCNGNIVELMAMNERQLSVWYPGLVSLVEKQENWIRKGKFWWSLIHMKLDEQAKKRNISRAQIVVDALMMGQPDQLHLFVRDQVEGRPSTNTNKSANILQQEEEFVIHAEDPDVRKAEIMLAKINHSLQESYRLLKFRLVIFDQHSLAWCFVIEYGL